MLNWYYNYYIKSVYRMFEKKQPFKYAGHKMLSVEDGNRWIAKKIDSGKPCCVARFGAIELALIRKYIAPILNEKKIQAGIDAFCQNAGFFPNDYDLAQRYALETVQMLKNIDFLINWGNLPMEEYIIKKYMNKNVQIGDKYTNAIDNKGVHWTSHLKGKRVLVIHPFEETITSQYYNNRKLLFENDEILPEFEKLYTIKAVQTIAGEKDDRFKTWFEALEWMYQEALKINFDVAIIGCGAYGMSLAMKLRETGKIAIHMGGYTQLLFGIKGKRWDDLGIYNEYWVRPSKDETPRQKDLIEEGCYW